MKVETTFEIGEEVYVIHLVDYDLKKCVECDQWGNVTRRDDWYGGYESVSCSTCHGRSCFKIKRKVPKWELKEDPKQIKYFRVFKDKVDVKVFIDLPPTSLFKFRMEKDPEYVDLDKIFRDKEAAGAYCKKLNKRIEEANNILKELT